MTEQQHRFRTLMGRFVTGVTVIAVPGSSGVAAMTANAVTAVSLEPLLLLCCVRNESRMLPLLLAEGRFSLNVLSATQSAVSRHYSGAPQTPSPAHWETCPLGMPVLAGAIAAFSCEVTSSSLAGDHTVIYGAVRHMAAQDSPPPALVYAAGRYRELTLSA